MKPVPNVPINVVSGKPFSSIAKNITETGHRIDINTALKTLYRNCQEQILRSVEALAILKFTPPPYVYKKNLS